MRLPMVFLVTTLLLFLAAMPWIVASCSPEPLLPETLREERSLYEAGVQTAQAATIEAQRAEPSTRKVVPVGTVDPSQVATPTVASLAVETTATLTPTMEPAIDTTPNATQVIELSDEGQTREQTSKRTITKRTVLTNTDLVSATEMITGSVFVVQSEAEISSSVGGTETPNQTDSTAAEDGQSSGIPIPTGLVDLTDLITTDMLADRVRQDAADLPLSDLVIDLSDRGFTASGRMGLLPGLAQPVQISGELAVIDYSLVVQVDLIRYGDRDVTSDYRGQVEDRINSSLYRLLPQRYVTGYEVEFGQLQVFSKGPSE